MHLAEMGCKQMAVYYAVNRSKEYLAHYGIRGMRWGVRKAIQKGDRRAYERQLRKATRKLEKLEKQASNGHVYARRALVRGVAAGNAVGLVAMGIQNPGMLAYKASTAGYNAYKAASSKRGTDAQKAREWRDAMNKEFNISALYASQERRRHKRKNYS